MSATTYDYFSVSSTRHNRQLMHSWTFPLLFQNLRIECVTEIIKFNYIMVHDAQFCLITFMWWNCTRWITSVEIYAKFWCNSILWNDRQGGVGECVCVCADKWISFTKKVSKIQRFKIRFILGWISIVSFVNSFKMLHLEINASPWKWSDLSSLSAHVSLCFPTFNRSCSFFFLSLSLSFSKTDFNISINTSRFFFTLGK